MVKKYTNQKPIVLEMAKIVMNHQSTFITIEQGSPEGLANERSGGHVVLLRTSKQMTTI